MKTLLISEIFPPQTGGSGRWFWEVYRRLPRADYMIAAGAHPAAAEFDATHDLDVERLPLTIPAWGLASLGGMRSYARLARSLRRVITQRRIRQLHCGRCLPEGWLAWIMHRLTGIPFACYVHGEDIGTAATSRELSWMVRRVFNAAKLLIANSHSTADMLRVGWKQPDELVHVLYPGVDTQRFMPAARDPRVRGELGWGTRTVLLTVGRLQRRKGHDMLIRALPQISRAIPDVLYAIVGAGEERRNLEALVEEYALQDHVRFHGEIPDAALTQCYQQADLFVLPNRAVGGDIEGFGMVLLEAQSCGLPVVAGDSGGTRETMQVPRTGRIVACDQPEPLAAMVTELLHSSSLRTQMSTHARSHVVAQFDWETLAHRAAVLFSTPRAHSSRAQPAEAISA